jgi:hypothetical protein
MKASPTRKEHAVYGVDFLAHCPQSSLSLKPKGSAHNQRLWFKFHQLRGVSDNECYKTAKKDQSMTLSIYFIKKFLCINFLKILKLNPTPAFKKKMTFEECQKYSLL